MSDKPDGGPAFEREIVFRPAFDRRNVDPKKNYGIHDAEICFYLKGPKATIQFVLSTGWYLPHVEKEFEASPPTYRRKAWGTDLGYHSPKPVYRGQTPISKKGECTVVPGGGECFYDGSTLNAEPIFEILVSKGHEAVWKELEKYYRYKFEAEEDQ